MRSYIFLMLTMWLCVSHTRAEKNSANIVLILIDDMGWKDLTCTGSTFYQTPHIDQLATEGTIFTHGYSTSPVCSPSRGAIFSGKSPARTGLTTVFGGKSDSTEVWHPYSKTDIKGANTQNYEAECRFVLPRAEFTFAEALQKNGYKTGYIGKWHCGWNENFWPDKQGFEYAEGYRTIPSGTKGHFGRKYIGVVKGLEDLKPDDDMADVLTEKALQFIEKNRHEPFLLVVSHYAVHGPLVAKEEVVNKYKRIPGSDQNHPVYAAMIESVDNSVGLINAKLKELGLDEHTLFVFTSDNGGVEKDTDSGQLSNTSNHPLLGGKSMAYEAAMRIPFIVKWPAKVVKGKKNDTPVISTDLYPTFLDAAGADLLPDQHLDGTSLLPLLEGMKLRERALHFHFPHYTSNTSPYSVIIDNDWKLIRFYNDASGGFQLFDMKNDPYEQNDLSEKYPHRKEALYLKMKDWQKSAGAKLPKPNVKFNHNLKATETGTDSYIKATKLRNQAEERLIKATKL